ncbi:MAG TPA: hypothetical protein VG269_22920 [Tepidisphaeraceae bacterium]|jgi:hypothetical protein|nr:hypothetical protein [Tepidisphaeraceae bacterium]
MRSRPFTYVCALSLLACVAVIVLWVHSYRRCDLLIQQKGPGDRFAVTSEFGIFVFEWEDRQEHAIKPGWVYFDSRLPRRWGRPGAILGFAVFRGSNRHYLLLPRTALRGVSIPHWFVAGISGVLPALWLARHRRERLARARSAGGLCAACGYDLRASEGRCPECGVDPASRAGAEMKSATRAGTMRA